MQNVIALLVPLLALFRGDGPDLTPVFGRDNAQFARALSRQGYQDLADVFCRKFDAWKEASAEERAAVRSVHLDLKLELAREESDPLKRKDAIAEVLKAKEEFIAQFPGSPEAEEAELTLPDAYRMLGEAFTSALEKSTDPAAAAKLREEGGKAFNHASEVLRARKKVLEKKLEDPLLAEHETEVVRDQRAAVWFNMARVEYFQSQLYSKDDPEFARRIKAALRTLQDFNLEYDDKLLTYQGYVFQGLCDKALGANDQALTDFDQAIGLRDLYETGADGKYKIAPEIDDVVSWAVLQKVNFLNDLGRGAEAIAASRDFFAKSQQPEKAQFGLALLAAEADAEFKSGDTKSAGEIAQRLQELDPNGPWGARGRDVLAQMLGGAKGGRGMGSAQLLRIADALIAKNDYDQALRACVRALDAASSDDDGCDVLVYMGAIYGKQGDLLAAVSCFDAAWQGYPKGSRAADALYRSISVYSELNAKEKRPILARYVEERRNKLANDYASSPLAAKIQLLQGQSLEQEQKFADAADFFLKVAQGSPNYEDAQYFGSRCLVKEAQRLIKAKQIAEAKAVVSRAETQLKATMKTLRASSEKTLDLNQKQLWEAESFECRTLLANLFMMEGVGRAADVPALLDGVEEQFPNDSDRIGTAWSLRIQAFSAIGQFDKAEALLESLLTKSPDSRGSAIAAGVFAITCDQRAVDAFVKDAKSKEGDALWKKAFRYYQISMKPRLKDPAAARSGDLERIAGRYFIMGQHFNGIPDRVQSFVGFPGKIAAQEYFEEAAGLYAASLEFVQSYRARIVQARALGFLGRFEEAAEIYAKVFEKEPLIDVATGEVNKQRVKEKPELLAAYLELGVCELKVAMANGRDADRMSRANQAFDLVVKSTKTQNVAPGETWWNATYWQIRAWVDQGDYKKASLKLRDVERNTSANFDEGKYGLQDLFKKMKTEVAGKVVEDQ
jgi:tetratricopeptide (TPR) repeat protein